jgi:hypothetical protein
VTTARRREEAAGAKREVAGLVKLKVRGGCGAARDRNSRQGGEGDKALDKVEREIKLSTRRAATDQQARQVSMPMSMGQPRVGLFPGLWPIHGTIGSPSFDLLVGGICDVP